MNSKVFIIHGWEGKPASNWFPWLSKELENVATVEIPYMPDPVHPNCIDWRNEILTKTGIPDKSIFLVGHSLGAIAILRYLENLPDGSEIGGAIFVAGFAESVHIPELDSFFETQVDFEKIKKTCKRFVVVDSDNDRYVPLSCGKFLEQKLSANHITLHNKGHFNEREGVTELPEVRDCLLEMMGATLSTGLR